MNTPVLLIVFKRLELTKKVFKEIKKAKPKKFYIACDGPRNQTDVYKVNVVKEYIINNIDWNCDLKTRFRDRNLGVGFGPADAITWFFQNEEYGIILEDDCLPARSFFEFCNALLPIYKNNKNIGMIQGFNPFPEPNFEYSYFFSKYNLCWGWATWRDRWELHDMYMSDWPNVKRSDFLKNFSNKNIVRSYWYTIFNLIHRTPERAWDAQFSYALFKNGLLTIIPKNNLIDNIGYESNDATSTKYSKPKHMATLKINLLNFPLIHPNSVITNKNWEKLVEKIHYCINCQTVLRLKTRDIMESSKVLSKILPCFVALYRNYKNVKYKIVKRLNTKIDLC